MTFFSLFHTELIFFHDILSADHVLFLNHLNSVSSKVTWGEEKQAGNQSTWTCPGCPGLSARGWAGGGTQQGWERSSPVSSLKSSSAKFSGWFQVHFWELRIC